MSESQQDLDWKKILSTAGPYPIEAFSFVREGLSYTAQHLHENPQDLSEAERHITGQQLCLCLRDFAIEKYGLLVGAVLDHWRVRRTDDFGRIVYAMVEAGLMSKTSNDSLDDFREVYDFGEVFSREEILARIAAG